jgi:toxin ParE1/3/4
LLIFQAGCPEKSFAKIAALSAGYRRSVCGVDSIFYRIVDDTVEIISILSRQDLDKYL